ncbi:MAG: hypothetical protein WCL57_01830, partial [Chloroflexota bacterium]
MSHIHHKSHHLVWLAILCCLLTACAIQTPTPVPKPPTPVKPEITLTIASVGSQPIFNKPLMTVAAGSRVTLEFTNSTSRGDRIMQNWVLVQPGAETGVISDAPNTTLDTSFIKPDDPRVIAFTTAVVGSQIAVVTFDAPPPGRYTYLSTAPRHQE